MRPARLLPLAAALILAPGPTRATKIFLNASDQFSNAVSCGGNEAQYAADEGQRAQARLTSYGFEVQYSQDFTNSPTMANNWGADTFLSIHSNAGGGHGTETLYKSTAGQTLAGHINDALVARLGLPDRGLVYRTDLHMLNATAMPAALTEVLFHDCTTTHDTPLGAMSESCFLIEADGRAISAEGIAQGFCAHYGVTCTEGPTTTPAPSLSMTTVIDDVPGQARDFDPPDGIFDLYAGQETLVHVTVTNAADATAPAVNVVAGFAADAPYVAVLEWHVYDNYPGNACGGAWCPNSAEDNPANPPHLDPGQAFDLVLEDFSEGESKRVDLRVRGAVPSLGVAAHPEMRCFVKHVDDFYDKADYDAAPNNVGGLQTWNGGDLKIRSAVDVWPPPDGGVPTGDAGAGDGSLPGDGGVTAGDGAVRTARELTSGCACTAAAPAARVAPVLVLLLGLGLAAPRRRRGRPPRAR